MTEQKLVKLSSLKANLTREADGDWIEYPEWPGVAFNVKSPMTPEYTTARDLALQDLNKIHLGKSVPDGEADAMIRDLYSRIILKGWRGLDEAYTPELGRKVCIDPEYRNVFNAIMWCSGRLSVVETEFVETEAKNSGKPSAGL